MTSIDEIASIDMIVELDRFVSIDEIASIDTSGSAGNRRTDLRGSKFVASTRKKRAQYHASR